MKDFIYTPVAYQNGNNLYDERDIKQVYKNYVSEFEKNQQLQARIKELESNKHINEIKAQGIEEAITKADGETYISFPGQCFPPQKQYKAELLCYAEHLRTKHD